MTILNKFAVPGPDVWYDLNFHHVLEDHMTYLRHHEKTRVVLFEPFLHVKYRFDFYSALNELGVEQYLHWVVLRMNFLDSPHQPFDHLEVIVVPDPSIVTQILSHYNTRKKNLRA